VTLADGSCRVLCDPYLHPSQLRFENSLSPLIFPAQILASGPRGRILISPDYRTLASSMRLIFLVSGRRCSNLSDLRT
jgi:hypothetical protein